MSRTRKFTSTIKIYFFGNALSKIILFFLLPLYTKYIPATDMGSYDTSITIITFVAAIITLDIGVAIMRYMFDFSNITWKNKVILNGMIIFSLSLILYFPLSSALIKILKFRYYLLIVIYGFLITVNSILGSISRGWGYSSVYTLSGIINTIVQVILNIVFILFFKWGYLSLYVAHICGYIVSIVILTIKCKLPKSIKIKYIDKKLIKEMFWFALPLSLNLVSFYLLNSINRVIISYTLGNEQTGYLSIANKFTVILTLFSTTFQLAWQEFAYEKENDNIEVIGPYYTKAYDLFIRILLIGLILIIPAIKLGITIFPNFIDKSYHNSIYLIPYALFGTLFSIASSFLSSIFSAIKRNTANSLCTTIGAIFNVLIIFICLYLNIGVLSAYIAFASGFAINLLLRMILLKKFINLKVNYLYFLILIPVYFIVSYVFAKLNYIYNLMIIFLIIILIPIFLKNELKTFLKKVGRRNKCEN